MSELPLYHKRDVSWLAFNHRVLQEAQDSRVPLYERIKFLAIYSANLDEFFRVRVASLRSFKALKKKTRKELDLKPKKELRQIRQMVQEQQTEFGRIFREEIIPTLQAHHIFLIHEKDYDAEQVAFVTQYFEEKININSNLQVSFLHENKAVPFLENAALYFIVTFEDADLLAIVNISVDALPRFIALPAVEPNHAITFLDDVIRYNLHLIFEQRIEQAYAIKLSRDAELNIGDEFDGNLIEKIKKKLEERNIGLPTRFLYDSDMPDELLSRLKNIFQLSKNDLIPGGQYHNFNDFLNFPNPLNDSNLQDIPLPPLPHSTFEKEISLLQAIQQQDYLLHFPYQKYDYVIRLIQEAANDEYVQSIKITLYRIAKNSAIVEALLEACRRGKHVTVFIEAKARFDEMNNLKWGAQLEAAGAHVFYSQPGIKVHSKLLLITKMANEKHQHFAYIGTGNFNEKTARLYTDHALLTADERLTQEVLQVFNYLENRVASTFEHLLVSPLNLRQRFINLIEREIAFAKIGKPAFMRLKMNSLEDKQMIDKLYEASEAGVQIQLIVRGICCLVAGVKGQSENIEVISIVDRFLEHARIYLFANGGNEMLYIASADWMTRNLDRRVEVATPIYNKPLFNELRTILDIQWRDNLKARRITPDLSNPHRVRVGTEPPVHAQVDIYRWLEQNLSHIDL